MCEWGTDVEMEVTVPAHLSHTGEARRKTIGIDSCIAPIVKALNDGGIETWGSCCGHGKSDGWISLADGRELSIKADRCVFCPRKATVTHDGLRRCEAHATWSYHEEAP